MKEGYRAHFLPVTFIPPLSDPKMVKDAASKAFLWLMTVLMDRIEREPQGEEWEGLENIFGLENKK